MAKKETPTIGEAEEFILNNASNQDIAKASMAAAFAVRQMFAAGETLQTPKNTEDWIQLYADHVWAYAGIYAIASTIAQLEPTLKKRDKETGELEEVKSHKILDLLNRPNDQTVGYDLFESLVVYLETCGDAYWETVWGTETTMMGKQEVEARSFPVELWPINPKRLTPEPAKDGHGVAQYVFQMKKFARKEYFRPDQIVPFHYHHPNKDWFGLGSLQPAIDDIRQDKQMAMWNLDFFEHGITPEGLLTTDERMTQKEMEDLGKQVKQFLAGKGRVVLMLSRGLKWQTVSLNPKDVEFLLGRKENRQAILAALGVPPIKVGLLEHAKYDNYALQLEAFHRDTIIPKVTKIANVLQNFLLPRFPDLLPTDTEEYVIGFDLTPLLKEDEDKLVKRFTMMMEFGLMTPNEARERMGMDPWPEEVLGGDGFYMKNSLVAVGPVGETEQQIELREDYVSQRMAIMEGEVSDRMKKLEDEIREKLEKERDQ